MERSKSISSKCNWWLIAAGLVLLFVPFIVLCLYAHPIADDYTYSPNSPFWETQKQLYLHWNGRYSANFMIMSNPILFHSISIYRIAAFLLLLNIPLSIYFLLTCIVGSTFSATKRFALSVILSVFILSLLPSLPEGIYWYPGAMTYILGCCVAMYYVGFVIRYQLERFIGNRFIHMCLCIALLFISVGFNEVQMLLFVFTHAAILFFSANKNRFRSIWAILFVFCIGFSMLMFFAPGNSGRESFFQNNHNFIHSFLMTVLQMPRFFFSWVSYTPLIIGSILAAPLSISLNKQSEFFRKLGSYNPITLFLLLGIILFLCIFPAYWSTDILGQHRTLNTACFYFVLIWFAFMHTIYSKGDIAEKVVSVLNATVKTGLTVLLFATLLFSGNCGNALSDITSGKIAGFDKEMNSRYALIAQAKKQGLTEVSMHPLENKPTSLFVLDIQPGCNHWINQQFATFYGLKKICCDTVIAANNGK